MKKFIKLILIVTISIFFSIAVATSVSAATTFEQSLSEFPDSYKPYLRKLHDDHPNWSFKAFKTGIKWSEALKNEKYPTRLLVPNTSIASWKSTASDDYSFSTGKWVVKSAPNWVQASDSIIKYYMDPRNFLNDESIFQFELLSYDSKGHTKSGVAAILKGSFMYNKVLEDKSGLEKTDTYSTTFMKIGKALKVSPYHLASRVRQEQGTSGNSPLISGKYSGYKGYYNYYNMSASGETYDEIITNGLKEAKKEGWNTRYKALYGGSKKLADKFINHGQDNLYLQKFDVDDSHDGLYWHQYMQNLLAADNEGKMVRSTYETIGALNNKFTFRIPVYTSMPSKACAKPKTTVVAPKLNSALRYNNSSIKISWTKVANASGYKVYRSKEKSSGYEVVKTYTTNDKDYYIDKSIKAGVTYYYKVKAYKKSDSKTSYSAYSGIKYIYANPKMPGDFTLTNKTSSSMILSWNKVGTTSGYEIYRSTSSTGTFKLVKRITSSKTIQYTDNNLIAGSTYYYKMRSYVLVDGKRAYSLYTTVLNKKVSSASPTITKIYSHDYNSIKFVWGKLEGVDGYYVYRSKSAVGNFTLIGSTKNNYYIDDTVDFAVPYYYKVRSFKDVSGTELLSDYSPYRTIATTVKKPANVAAVKSASKQITLSWSEVNGAEGYVIYRKTGKDGKYAKVKTINSGDITSFVNGKRTKDKYYYYKIKAFRKTDAGKYVYSAYSKEVKRKV